MGIPPFYNIPYRNNYQRYCTYYNNIQSSHEKIPNKKPPKPNNFATFNFNSFFNSDFKNPIIEILGLKLYLDDIIILILLFFLYEEDVHDEILFGILLLLLLS